MIINIVGLQYRGLTDNFIMSIGQSIIHFIIEKDNRYDKYAVQCISNGIHFGYIEKDKSQLITSLISSKTFFTYTILEKDNFKIKLKIEYLNKNQDVSINIPNDSNCSGIYKINFIIEGSKLSYIGQSSNISKRIQSHIKDLKNGVHHNKKMQYGWLQNPNSFSFSVLFKSDNSLSPLDRQIILFEKEHYFIELEKGHEVNSIEADLVFTNESIQEFDSINNDFKKLIKKIRENQSHKKEKLGKLILDLKILDRVKKPLQHAEVKDTNVTTWINKKRYSPLDYVPKIRLEVKGSQLLINALLDLNSQQKTITKDNVFVENFKKDLFKRRNSYDTCGKDNLNRYMNIMKSYQKFSSNKFTSNYKSISNGRIEYDSSLLEIFNKTFLDSLSPYIG